MLDAEDALVEQGYRDLVGCCLAYLGWPHGGPELRAGEEYYRSSLAPAAAWGSVGGGGVPDRRMRVAVTEADLHRAMMALPPMLLTVAQLSRTSRTAPGWVRTWDERLGHLHTNDWYGHRDERLTGWTTRTRSIGVARIIGNLVHDAAHGMAGHLGTSWMNL